MVSVLKKIILAVVMIVVVRYAIIENPSALRFYGETFLNTSDISPRQWDVLRNEIELLDRDKYPEKLTYFAVGSSQTDFLFRDYVETDPEFDFFHLGAFGPVDAILYREQIFSRNPDTILMYISEFDLSYLRWGRYALAPGQGRSLLSLYQKFSDSPYSDGAYQMAKELFVSEFLPERKYSFIFKGFLNKYARRDKLLRERAKIAMRAGKGPLKEGRSFIKGDNLKEKVEFNLGFLEDFLVLCKERGIEVIMLGGVYNPKYYEEINFELAALTKKRLTELAAKHDGVSFIPAELLYQFSEEDFVDFIHVSKEAGERFRENLFSVHLGYRGAPR